ncbi:MAG TPA: aminotransferase class I/II-fold pyridoxal phosphate-dependent enzyme, partial [Pyrinomonadaceae bacterium]|nr:aminotransferase class I/II-fold pyridoxal phosphate-dependent enzyme [Pyrinomonadaceae bacterium]
PPIHLSTTFEHGPASEELHGYMYIRDKNPTQDRLEEAFALLEGGEGALVYSSGMGAAITLLLTLDPDSHVIFPEDVYAHVRVAHQQYLPKWNFQVSVVDMQDHRAIEHAIRPNTKLVWVETPSNPRMTITDIAAAARAAHSAGALLLVDNTFATPIFQRPLDLGADIVLHSTTKYSGGHSDVQGGCLVLKKRDQLYDKLFHARIVLGAVCSPFNSWLVLRGLRTLPCRMEKHAANARAVAKALEACASVERVFYPGLPSHPGHSIASTQMSDFGGMMSILVKGGREQAIAAASRVKLFRNATSLGGVESLVEHRFSAEQPDSKSPENLLRLTIGLEHPDDLIEDLLQALNA